MNELKLNKIETLQSGVKLAKMTLKIKSITTYTDFNLTSTGTVLRVDSSHLTKELNVLLEWLNKSSENEDNLRTNESEIIIFAKEMFKANDKLNEIKEL